MAKNLMPEVAALLGVRFGEVFFIETPDYSGRVLLDPNGLYGEGLNRNSNKPDKLLCKLLKGLCEVQIGSFAPKNGDTYYAICFRGGSKPNIECYKWEGCIEDFALQQLEIIYRTKAEAMAHMAEDYERLTGRKLEE